MRCGGGVVDEDEVLRVAVQQVLGQPPPTARCHSHEAGAVVRIRVLLDLDAKLGSIRLCQKKTFGGTAVEWAEG